MSHPLPACPVETTLTLISDKWKILILRDLSSGTKRFGQLKKSLSDSSSMKENSKGISQKVLTSNLRQMEDSGLLSRTVFPEVPPHVEYSLTDLGQSLEPVLTALATWGMAYQHKFQEDSLQEPLTMPQTAEKKP